MAAPELRPGVPSKARAWREGSWDAASPGRQGKQPHPHGSCRRWEGHRGGQVSYLLLGGLRSKGLGPHPVPGPQHTHKHTLSWPLGPNTQGRCLGLAEEELMRPWLADSGRAPIGCRSKSLLGRSDPFEPLSWLSIPPGNTSNQLYVHPAFFEWRTASATLCIPALNLGSGSGYRSDHFQEGMEFL